MLRVEVSVDGAIECLVAVPNEETSAGKTLAQRLVVAEIHYFGFAFENALLGGVGKFEQLCPVFVWEIIPL